jgi:hypothetical protein
MSEVARLKCRRSGFWSGIGVFKAHPILRINSRGANLFGQALEQLRRRLLQPAPQIEGEAEKREIGHVAQARKGAHIRARRWLRFIGPNRLSTARRIKESS